MLTPLFSRRVLPCLWLGLALFSHSLMARAALPIQHWTQASGAKVYLVESHGIAMLDVQIDFDAGGRRDPADKVGLASAMSRMSGKGLAARPGALALDENQLSEAWADLGAVFTVSAGSDRLTFSMRSLSYPDLLAQSVALAARQIGEPAWPDAIWQQERERISASIRESDTRPATVAAKAFRAAVYGPHPYGLETTPASLARITTADMQQFLCPACPALQSQSQRGRRCHAGSNRCAGHCAAGPTAPA